MITYKIISLGNYDPTPVEQRSDFSYKEALRSILYPPFNLAEYYSGERPTLKQILSLCQ
jgi:hypothetical protein